jgi:hypothetical protein
MLMECAPISVEVRTSLATAKLRWNIWFSVVPSAPCIFGGAHGVLHLAQDLGFAQHHRVEPAGHTKGVARRLRIFQGVDVGPQHGGGDAAAMGQPVQRMVGLVRLARAIDLGAVAGGDDGGFRMVRKGLSQSLQRGRDLVDGKGKTAAQIQRRGCVIDA